MIVNSHDVFSSCFVISIDDFTPHRRFHVDIYLHRLMMMKEGDED